MTIGTSVPELPELSGKQRTVNDIRYFKFY